MSNVTDQQRDALAALKEMSAEDMKQVDNWFTYHPPKDGDPDRYEAIREAAKVMAYTIIGACPPSADRTVAIRKIREAVMTANASIACGGE